MFDKCFYCNKNNCKNCEVPINDFPLKKYLKNKDVDFDLDFEVILED